MQVMHSKPTGHTACTSKKASVGSARRLLGDLAVNLLCLLSLLLMASPELRVWMWVVLNSMMVRFLVEVVRSF